MNTARTSLRVYPGITLIVFLISGCSVTSDPPIRDLDLSVRKIIQLPQDRYFYSVEFINEFTGWAVGKDGVIYQTNNSGDIWTPQSSPVADDLISVQFIDGQNGWIAGTNNVLRTQDAGKTWQIVLAEVPFSKLACINFLDKNTGWVSGTADGKIYYTTNAGVDWLIQQVDTMGRIISLSFIDESLGYAFSNITGIYKTENGGHSWNKMNVPGFCSTIFFTNSNEGYAGNNIMLSSIMNDNAEIFYTNDGGITWTPQTIPDATAVWKIDFLFPETGFAIAGGICGFNYKPSDWVECGQLIFTSNGGGRWNKYTGDGILQDVTDFKIFTQNTISVLTKNGKVYFLDIN